MRFVFRVTGEHGSLSRLTTSTRIAPQLVAPKVSWKSTEELLLHKLFFEKGRDVLWAGALNVESYPLTRVLVD